MHVELDVLAPLEQKIDRRLEVIAAEDQCLKDFDEKRADHPMSGQFLGEQRDTERARFVLAEYALSRADWEALRRCPAAGDRAFYVDGEMDKGSHLLIVAQEP